MFFVYVFAYEKYQHVQFSIPFWQKNKNSHILSWILLAVFSNSLYNSYQSIPCNLLNRMVYTYLSLEKIPEVTMRTQSNGTKHAIAIATELKAFEKKQPVKCH
jgi:hypothetical protein